jgi:quinoprotein glucose dehydrogenase
MPGSAQRQGTENGEWRYFIGDIGASRSNPALTQINASNFGDLEVAWIWRGDNFGPEPYPSARAVPIYVDGMLYTVSGIRRTVVALDPTTGETIWTFREPNTTRFMRSPRAPYGKGVAYAEVNGRGVIYITTPAFFLWALDAKTGQPLENWGTPVPLPGFPQTGVVDLIPDLIGDWGPWLDYVAAGGTYDPDYGIPRELGMVTSSSPPIVSNGVILAQTAHEPAYGQTRIENVPGDLSGYDAATGQHLWKFHVLPRPGEFGHETWENDAWQWSGNMGQWAPASADPELGLFYFVTNASTIEAFTGHRPGANLFGGSVIALDARTGERRWHFQIHHSDRWNYDLPAAPILLDLNVPGRGEIPALIQNTKQGLVFAFNRETGEPIWPIEERPVPQTQVPGDWTSPTQPFPTLPSPLDSIAIDGLTDKYIMDYTPEVRAEALEILAMYDRGGTYAPPLPVNHQNEYVAMINCGMSGLNIPTPAVADPRTNIMYASHSRGCGTSGLLEPTNGVDVEITEAVPGTTETPTTGRTVVPWLPGGDDPGLLDIEGGLQVYKPYGGIVAIDMDTGQKVFDMPTSDIPADIRNHPMLQGVDIPNTGSGGAGIMMVMGDLLLQTGGGGRGGGAGAPVAPRLNARDLQTGEVLAFVELPANGQYGMMTFMHEGKQYIVVNSSSGPSQMPGGFVALTLP